MEKIINKLNGCLGWELRAATMYSHYAAYVKGIHRLQLKTHFEAEATESHGHADIVRAAIVKLDGEAVTERDTTEIVHTTDYEMMLEEAMKTEQRAAESYQEVLNMIKDDDEMYDALEQIFFDEARSVEELKRLS